MKTLLGFASLLVLQALIVPPPIPAQQQPITLYVNRTDPNCGGHSPCFSTIQAAVTAAAPGNSIHIQAGTYPEQLSITGKNNFQGATEVDRIVVEADPATQPGQVVLTGAPGACTGNHAIRLQQSKFVTIRGLTITGTGGQAISLLGGNNQNQDIHIELNRIFGNGSGSCNGGITVARGNPGTLIVNNLIHFNGRNGITFIDADGGPHYLINNTIFGNQWNGIDVARIHTITLANNIVNKNGTASGTTGGRYGVRRESATSPQPAGIKLLNNLVCGNTQGQISAQVLDPTDSSNFTPMGNEGPGVGALPGCDLPSNLFGNLNGPDNQPDTVDDDFSLKANSLAIDVGMDPRTLGFNPAYNPIFEADFVIEGIRPADGNADRVADFDVGAFEFSGDVSAPQVVVQSPASNAHVRQTITVSAQATDNIAVSAITLSASNQNLVSSVSPSLPAVTATASALWDTTTVSDGPITIEAGAMDAFANSGSASSSVIVDNTPPNTQIESGPVGQITQTSAAFTFTGTDNLTAPGSLAFAWRVDGAAYSSFNAESSVTINGLAAGSHTFEVKARDLAGNEDSTPASRAFTVQLGPSISTVDPPGGIIGTLVNITGSNFEPGISQVSFNGATGVIRAITATMITTAVPPSATTGPMTVTSSQGTASRNFTVTTSQDFSVVANPSSVQSVQGGSTRVLIDATPSNGFSGLIQLATSSLPLGIVANFSPSTLAPNNHSVLALNTTSNTPAGAHIVEIRARSHVDGQLVTKTTTVTLNVATPGQTVLVGQVLDGDDRPLSNVSIKLGGTSLTHLGSSDAAGNLFIPLSGTGPTVFLIDGSPANTDAINYPTIPVTIDIQAAAINELGYIPRLRGQAVAKLISFVPGQATIITDPDLPGFKMTIPAGVQIIGWDGQPNSQFGVTKVPIGRSPLPPLVLPQGLEARETYLFSFGKVGGGVPSGNIPIDTPNSFGALPSEKADLYFFNEAPDGSAPNQWEKYGTATVSDDGTTLVTDINPATGLPYGIPRFCCGALTPVFNFINRLFGASGGPSDGGKKAGDPVDVSTGFFYLDKTDMVLPGRLPVVVTRTYRTNMTNAGPFGIGTSASFEISLQAPSVFDNQTIVLISPGNKQDIFSRQANGTYINTTAPSFRGAVLTNTGPQEPVFFLRFKDGMVWRFNFTGTLASQSDRNGNIISFGRDSFNRVVRIQEPAGRELILNYGDAGLGNASIQSITDPIGRQVRYTYDAAGRLETVIDPAGGVTRYAYDSSNRMVTLKDARGIEFLTNEYDTNGRVSRQTQADGGIWTFEYTSSGSYVSQSVVTNPRGHATTYRFNASGYQISETDALGQNTIFERHTATNQILSVSDSLKRVTRFQYDTIGNVTRVIDPAGNPRTFSYNPSFNTVAEIIDAMQHTTRFEYDSVGNLTAILDPLGNRMTFAYDGSGQPTSTTDPLGNSTTLAYDNAGNLTRVTDPLGNRTERNYDQVSRLVSLIDPRGKVTSFVYDNLNRPTSVTDPAGGATLFTYDGNGNPLFFTDARNSVTSYNYDSMDRVVSRIDPLGSMEFIEYDGMGNYRRHVDRKGQEALFFHDELNRLISGNYTDGTSANVVYDAASRIVQATDSAVGMIANQYDRLNRLVAQITNQGTVNYEYDLIGRRTRMTVPGQLPVTYEYDAASRLTQILQALQVVNFSYDALGRKTRTTLPNGVFTNYQYNANSRLTALTYHNASGVLGNLTYQYDRASNRTGIGGSFARILLPDPIAIADYDSANRQLRFGNNTMVYDQSGNLTTVTNSSGITTFNWDTKNRLKGIAGAPGSSNFTYDVFGRREKKIISGDLTQYLYDGVNPVQESSATTVRANILPGLEVDEFFSRTDLSSASASYFIPDALGSVIGLADSASTIQTEYSYEPFGKTAATGASNTSPFQYTSRENEGSGLYYYRARYYHPGLQRFISEDPIGFVGGDPNLYAYTRNSPTIFRDPSGEILVPAAVVAGVLCATGATAGASAHHIIAGRKSTFLGFLGGAALGCAAGLGLGGIAGIAFEAAFPSYMLAGAKASLWAGAGARGATLAGTNAAATAGATIHQTFTGSALKLAELVGVSSSVTGLIWPHFSSRFVSGAGSATVFIGRAITEASVFLARELPVLQRNAVNIEYVFLP